jgi:hypothetical protein
MGIALALLLAASFMISAPIHFRITPNSNITLQRQCDLDLNQPGPD